MLYIMPVGLWDTYKNGGQYSLLQDTADAFTSPSLQPGNKVDNAGPLKSIATTGYNVGFGAKKQFATYDIAEKVPGWIGFISSAVGILALVFEPLSAKLPSAILVILGACTFYINAYKGKDYDVAGKNLTQIFNQLRDLYQSVEGGGSPSQP